MGRGARGITAPRPCAGPLLEICGRGFLCTPLFGAACELPRRRGGGLRIAIPYCLNPAVVLRVRVRSTTGRAESTSTHGTLPTIRSDAFSAGNLRPWPPTRLSDGAWFWHRQPVRGSGMRRRSQATAVLSPSTRRLILMAILVLKYSLDTGWRKMATMATTATVWPTTVRSTRKTRHAFICLTRAVLAAAPAAHNLPSRRMHGHFSDGYAGPIDFEAQKRSGVLDGKLTLRVPINYFLIELFSHTFRCLQQQPHASGQATCDTTTASASSWPRNARGKRPRMTCPRRPIARTEYYRVMVTTPSPTLTFRQQVDNSHAHTYAYIAT